MVELYVVFWMFVFVFAFIGFVRGWAREVLISASVVFALFVIFVLEQYVPLIGGYFESKTIPDSNVIPIEQFWFRILVLGLMLFLGYEGPSLPRISGSRFQRDNWRDSLLGLVMGALNGYLIVGTLWAFLDEASYPFGWVSAPPTTVDILTKMPPDLLMQIPHIFIAMIVVFLLIIGVLV